MRAWEFTGTHEPFVRVELPDPKPRREEVVIAVKAAGICHSDVSIFEDEQWLVLVEVSVVPGHEIVGVIESVDAGVSNYAEGERVAVWPMPPDAHSSGFSRDSGFAEKVAAGVEMLIPIPDDVPADFAAAATDARVTSHRTVIGAGEVTAGMKVSIIGFGGPGQIGGRVAVLKGAEAYVAEVKREIWPRASEVGAGRAVEHAMELADEQLDVIVDSARLGTTTTGAIEAIRPAGRVLQIGMSALEATIKTVSLIAKRVQLIGSLGGGLEGTESDLRSISSGDLSPTVEHTDFARVAPRIRRFKLNDVSGRLVAEYA